MNLGYLRRQIAAGRVRIELVIPHALTEALKDGLTVEELKYAVTNGEVIEDYGTRVLLFALTISDHLPYHVVLEYYSGDPVATVVTSYIPDATQWQSDWKRRKKPRRKRS